MAWAGQKKMGLLGYSVLPTVLVQDAFAAIGRLAGTKQPAAPTPQDCKNHRRKDRSAWRLDR